MTDLDDFLGRIQESSATYAQQARWARSDAVGEAQKPVFEFREKILVERLTALREHMNLSQTDIAKRMTARGFPMQQSTIAKIESHGRPLRLSEYFAICATLGVPDLAVSMGASVAGQSDEVARLEALSTQMESAIESREQIRTKLIEDLTTWAGMYAERDAEVLWLGSLLQQAAIDANNTPSTDG